MSLFLPTTSSGKASAQSSYNGTGAYTIGSAGDTPNGGPTQTGSGTTTESGKDGSTSKFTDQYAFGGGSWKMVSGTVTASSGGSSQATDSASGAYTRPLLGGTLQGTWQEAFNTSSTYSANTSSTLDGYGNWITTGSGTNTDDASGSASNSGSGTFSQSSSSSYAGGGSDSYMSGNADENSASAWTYHDSAQSALASDGTTTSVATVTASGNSSGGDDYSATGGSDSWSNTGDSSNSTHSESHDAWGMTISESAQGNWQQAYTVNAGPGGATTTVGTASGSGQANGDSAAYDNSNGSTTVSIGGVSGGTSQSNSVTGSDHYKDQSNWVQVSNADGTQGFTRTAMNQVWGSSATTWTNQGWGSLTGAGSANVWNLGGSSGLSYNLPASVLGFSGSAAFLRGPGWIGPSSFGIKFGPPLPTSGLGEFMRYTALGWWEANSFGLASAGQPPTAWGRAGLFTGHLLALGQGLAEMELGAGAVGGGTVATVTVAGAPIGIPVAGLGVIGIVHGGAVTTSAGLLLGRDLAVMMSATNPPGGGAAGSAPAPGQGPSLGQRIANGHAYDKHVIQQGEFPGITNRADFAKLVDQAISEGKATGNVRNLAGGRVAFWDDLKGIVVIQDPGSADGGTAFIPTAGKAYFLNLK